VTLEELAAIKARTEAATRGPWRTGYASTNCKVDHGKGFGGHNGKDCRYTFSFWMDGEYGERSISRALDHRPGDEVPPDSLVCGMWGYEDGGVRLPVDADFIAAARDDVPALVAEVERLRQALEDYGRHSEGCSGQYGPSYRCRCGWRDEARALSVGDGEGAA
jgi:hypothetical protein